MTLKDKSQLLVTEAKETNYKSCLMPKLLLCSVVRWCFLKTDFMKYVKRILGLPFFLMLNIVGIFFHLCKISKAFILYGGEAMAYDKKTTPKMVADLYYKMVEIKDINDWIEWKKTDLRKAKTKFQENNCKDWIEIPDYKISILEELQKNFKLKI